MYKKISIQIFFILFIAIVVITAVHFFVAQPFLVSGDSMQPDFASGNYLIIDELSYYLHAPRRGDLVVFRYPVDPSIFFIKRLVGLPGDTVTVRSDGEVVVKPQGQKAFIIDEPFIIPQTLTTATTSITLDSDEYFVLGDNRDASFDSRAWGPVPGRYIIGRVVARLWPPAQAGLFPGAYPLPQVTATTTTTIHS